MFRCLRENKPCLPDWWARFIIRHSTLVLVVGIGLTIFLGFYSATHFSIYTDVTEMVDQELPFQQDMNRYRELFPVNTDTLVVVIDARTPEAAEYVRDRLTQRFRSRPQTFLSVFAPGQGEFYRKNGLLYLDEEELLDTADQLARIQPFLGMLSRDLSIESLFNILGMTIRETDDPLQQEQLVRMLTTVGAGMEEAVEGDQEWISWRAMMGEESAHDDTQAFVVLYPVQDYTAINPAGKAMREARAILEDVQEEVPGLDLSLRLTGSIALRAANLGSVEQGMTLAVTASLILVTLSLFAGLDSWRMVISSVATLLMGLICTMGFATLVIGSLNIVSITFVVLFIGLGIDYSIQFGLRCRELLSQGQSKNEAISHAFGEVGNALILCTASTTIGFYAFVPTAYIGASELGIIAGTGMIINLLANLTILPALIVRTGMRPPADPRLIKALPPKVARFPQHHAKSVLAGMLVLTGSAALLLPMTYFDYNPLNLADPESEAIVTARELMEQPRTSIWTINIMADSAQDASRIVAELEDLEIVDSAVTVDDLVPENQPEKLMTIEEMAFFLPVMPEDLEPVPTTVQEALQSLQSYIRALEQVEATNKREELKSRFLAQARELARVLETSGEAPVVISTLENKLLEPLKLLLEQLAAIPMAREFDKEDLPQGLRERFQAGDVHLVQVFPSENLNDLDAMARFADEVRSVAPAATGPPVSILEAGRAISDAFMQALGIAVGVIILFLLLVFRNPVETILALLPLVAALILTAATTVIVGIPFDFSNIIILPLILGIGLDYGLHIIQRFKADKYRRDRLLSTSTARGVFFSALTTIASFGTLMLSEHKGTFGMGAMLMVSTSTILICTLIMLPSLLTLFGRRVLKDVPQEKEV